MSLLYRYGGYRAGVCGSLCVVLSVVKRAHGGAIRLPTYDLGLARGVALEVTRVCPVAYATGYTGVPVYLYRVLHCFFLRFRVGNEEI